MSYCVNPECPHPQNADNTSFCTRCSSKLLLKERYRPLHPLGRGGFGRTFLAVDEDIPSQPPCVVKQFYFSDREPELYTKAIDLFHQESQHLEELGKHPQIPSLFAYFEQDQRSYLVQEFIQGKTLKEELEQQGVYDESRIWQLLFDLLPVLQYIHARHVIHRDIKPENIIRRSSDNKPVLIDFGIAKVLTNTALLRPATLIGSHDYAAPEQTKGKVFPASDLYSLGVTCIRLLTKVPPLDMYDFENDRWLWERYLPKDTTISYPLAQILDKLLQSKLTQRYQSAQDVLQDLIEASETTTQNLSKRTTTTIPDSLSSLGNAGPEATTETFPPLVIPEMETDHDSAPQLSLISAAGVDYTELRDLLVTKKWLEADRETWKAMCQALSLPLGTQLEISQIHQLPCEDLLLIDSLWFNYSQGRFGFSVQTQIYESVQGDYVRFCDRVHWPTYNSPTTLQQLRFNQQAPQGHLPSRLWVGGFQWLRHLDAMSAKLAKCSQN